MERTAEVSGRRTTCDSARLHRRGAFSRRRRRSCSSRRGSSPATNRRWRAPYDYRLFNHPGGVPLIVIRGDDSKVRSFYNICPHRGNTILYDPAGNAKRMTCIFHAVVVRHARQLHRHLARRAGLPGALLQGRRGTARSEDARWATAASCGSTSTTTARRCAEYIGGAMDILEPYMQQPMEVFHYHKARRATRTTSCGTTRTASSITTSCTTLIASPG